MVCVTHKKRFLGKAVVSRGYMRENGPERRPARNVKNVTPGRVSSRLPAENDRRPAVAAHLFNIDIHIHALARAHKLPARAQNKLPASEKNMERARGNKKKPLDGSKYF